MHKDHPGTAMVAFFLSGEQAAMLAVPDGEPVSNLHVTVFYLGDTSEIQNRRVEARTLVQRRARRTAPFSGALSRLSHFGPDDDGLTAVVLELDSEPAHWFRAQLSVDFSDARIEWDRKFPEYRPHVTLGYWPEDEIPERFSKPGPLDDPIPVTFSEVSVMWDGERTDTSLGATAAGDNSTVESLTAVQASAIEETESIMAIQASAFTLLEFHGVNTHNEKAHGRRGPGKPDLPDVDISIKKPKRKGGRVSAAKPTNKGALADFDPGKGVRIEPRLHNEKQQAAILARVAKVPGFEDTADMDVETATKTVLDRLSANIEEGFRRSVEDYGLDRTLQHSDWYPAANEAGVEWAEEFDFEPDAVFAALAVLSPQADWGDNVAWSRFVAEKIHKQDEIEVTQEIVDAYEAAQQIAYRSKVKAYESGKRPTKPVAPEPTGLPVGKKLSELDDDQAAQAIRGMGNAEGLMQGLFGNPSSKARANRDSAIANAVSVLRDPSTENIDRRLGKEHKVRSFYNNIRDPLDKEFEDVTADTHHFGAAFGHPWPAASEFLSSGSKDAEGNAQENKNIWGAVGTGETGATGAYPLVAEATRIATTNINKEYDVDIRPAQMQSVVWEYHRNSWPARARTAAIRKKIEGIRSQEAKGELSHEEAMEQIDAIRNLAPGAAPRDKLLDQLMGTYKPTKKTRQRVVKKNDQ